MREFFFLENGKRDKFFRASDVEVFAEKNKGKSIFKLVSRVSSLEAQVRELQNALCSFAAATDFFREARDKADV